ncbi:MAG: cytochrome b/b6 domain-containing protein [Devosia sp.]
MTTTTRTGYASIQIGLHWCIASLVVFQLVFGESMVKATEAAEEGEPIGGTDALLATAHYWVGLSILALVFFRLAVRIWMGTSTSTETNRLLALLVGAVHWAFYTLLVVVPVTGLLAIYANPEISEIHALAKPVFIALIAVHAAAALFHQFVLRDGALMRILVPAK